MIRFTGHVIAETVKDDTTIIAVHSDFIHDLPIIGYFQSTENFPYIPEFDIGNTLFDITIYRKKSLNGNFYNKIYIEKL